MKKWIVLALSLTVLLGLTACGNGNTEAEKLAVYSLSGKNEDFRIINGMIVVTDEKQVLSGGDLELLGDGVFEDIVFYSTTFCIVADGERETILSNSVSDQTGGSVKVSGSLGAVSGEGVFKANQIEEFAEIKDNLWFVLETRDFSGKEREYHLQLNVKEIAG